MRAGDRRPRRTSRPVRWRYATLLGLPDLIAVDPGDGPDLGLMPAVHLLQRVGDLADGGLGPGRVDRQREQVVAQTVLTRRTVRGRGPGQFGQRGLRRRLVAFGAQLRQLGDLLGAHPAVLDLEHLDLVVLVDPVLVDPDHRLLDRSRCGPGCGRRPPRCAASGCRRRWPGPSRRARRPRRYARGPAAAS